MKHNLTQRRASHKPARATALRLSLPETDAGIFVHQRYHVPAAISDLIASLAGLGGNRESLK